MDAMAAGDKFLVCPPRFYRIEYVINPWMEGNIGRTDLDSWPERGDAAVLDQYRRGSDRRGAAPVDQASGRDQHVARGRRGRDQRIACGRYGHGAVHLATVARPHWRSHRIELPPAQMPSARLVP